MKYIEADYIRILWTPSSCLKNTVQFFCRLIFPLTLEFNRIQVSWSDWWGWGLIISSLHTIVLPNDTSLRIRVENGLIHVEKKMNRNF